jgi:hypothetical protein
MSLTLRAQTLQQQLARATEHEDVNGSEVGALLEDSTSRDQADRPVLIIDRVDEARSTRRRHLRDSAMGGESAHAEACEKSVRPL